MTLVKLDSGDYINTMYVIKTMTDTAGSVGNKNGQLVYLLDTGYQKITPADRNRIVAAINGKSTTSVTVGATNAIARELAQDAHNARRRGNIL